jgi:hypothetical protein
MNMNASSTRPLGWPDITLPSILGCGLRVYNYMALGLGVTGLVACGAVATGLYEQIAATPPIWVVMVAPLAAVLILSFRIDDGHRGHRGYAGRRLVLHRPSVWRTAIVGRAFSCLYRSGAMKHSAHRILIAVACGLGGCAEGYGGYGGGYGPAYYGSNYLGYGGGYDHYNRRPPPYVYQQRQFHQQPQQQATPRPAPPPPPPAANPPSPQEGQRLLNQLGIRYN